MAISIDGIVRSIEDGKISEEERTKARDVWSRIDGINEKVKFLLLRDLGETAELTLPALTSVGADGPPKRSSAHV